jgi:hypothetical protein
MNSFLATRIEAFRDEVVEPTFLDLKAELETPETSITIVKSTENTKDLIAAVLHRMHPEVPYFGQAISSPSAPSQSWIIASVYVEILESPEPDAICLGQYCLSIEIDIALTAQIQVRFIVSHRKGRDNQLEIEPNHQPIALENINRFDLFDRFFEGFEYFERHLSEPETIQTQTPIASETKPALALYINEPSITPPASETSPLPPDEAQPEPIPFIDPQTLYDLSKQLTQALAPKGFPIYSKFNPKLPTSAQIKPIQDRYQRTIDLGLEYSPAITEAELTEYLHRLGHYQTLKHLAHLHIFIQEQMQAWFKQNGQPSLGAIAPHLQHHIIELRDHLYQRIQTLIDCQLDTTAQTLQTEVHTLTTQQQQRQTLLNELEQNPLLGYLDTHLLDPTNQLKQPLQPFTNPNQPINLPAQHYKTKNSRAILSHIASCDSEKYKTYHQRKPDRPALKLIIEYTITQKLYPQRPVFIGVAPKPVYPRLELLWGQTDDTSIESSPLNQIWCIYPMMRTDPPQWLIVAATTDTQPLRSIPLENGQIAQEGTREYLCHTLHLMTECKDEYTQALSNRVTEALENRRIKYLHIHQTQNSQTQTPRDIIQMQFQLFG